MDVCSICGFLWRVQYKLTLWDLAIQINPRRSGNINQPTEIWQYKSTHRDLAIQINPQRSGNTNPPMEIWQYKSTHRDLAIHINPWRSGNTNQPMDIWQYKSPHGDLAIQINPWRSGNTNQPMEIWQYTSTHGDLAIQINPWRFGNTHQPMEIWQYKSTHGDLAIQINPWRSGNTNQPMEIWQYKSTHGDLAIQINPWRSGNTNQPTEIWQYKSTHRDLAIQIHPWRSGNTDQPTEIWQYKSTHGDLAIQINPRRSGNTNQPMEIWQYTSTHGDLAIQINPWRSGNTNQPTEIWQYKSTHGDLAIRITHRDLAIQINPLRSGNTNQPMEIWQYTSTHGDLAIQITPWRSGNTNQPMEIWQYKSTHGDLAIHINPWRSGNTNQPMEIWQYKSTHGDLAIQINPWRSGNTNQPMEIWQYKSTHGDLAIQINPWRSGNTNQPMEIWQYKSTHGDLAIQINPWRSGNTNQPMEIWQYKSTHGDLTIQINPWRAKDVEKKLQQSYRQSRETSESKAVSAIKRNVKYFFGYAKKFSTIKTGIGPFIDAAQNIVSCPLKMAEMLSTQYSGVFSSPKEPMKEASEIFPDGSRTEPWLHNVPFDEDDIIEAIDEIPTTAAAGPDRFPALLLKNCKHSLSKPLFQIWRRSLDLGEIPQLLKTANVIPIHKGKSQGIPANYRPVALTSHLIKLFEKVIRKYIVSFMEENELFNPGQHGFRLGRSCLSQLIAHYDHITQLLEKGQNVDVIYLDFAKAFDKVDFLITMKKLHDMGITGKLGRWIHSFLTNRTQTVVVNGVKSHPASVNSGVPQGSVLGPLLFLVLIGDIDREVASAFVSSFADDTRAAKGIRTQDDTKALQTDLGSIYKWAEENNMMFNFQKFECLRYGGNTELKATTKYTTMNGDNITVMDHAKDLGVTMSSSGTFRQHISNVTNTAYQLSGWVLRTFRTRHRIPMLTLWKSLILSKLDYCSQLWSPTQTGVGLGR